MSDSALIQIITDLRSQLQREKENVVRLEGFCLIHLRLLGQLHEKVEILRPLENDAPVKRFLDELSAVVAVATKELQ